MFESDVPRSFTVFFIYFIITADRHYVLVLNLIIVETDVVRP